MLWKVGWLSNPANRISISVNRGNRWKFKKCAFEESPLHPEFDETILISFFDYFYIFEDHYRTLSKQTILQS